MIGLYAITDHPRPPLPDATALHTVRADDLAAVCAPAETVETTAEALWRHEEMVEALMWDRDLLPVRYGTRLPDDAAVARAVGERRDDLIAALERVRGAVELSVRVISEAAGAGPQLEPACGADYMRARARFGAVRGRAQRTVHAPLAALARAAAQRTPRAPSELLRAAYLVDRDVVGAFARLVARLEETSPELRVLCTGPWPPYSFAGT